MKKNIILLIIAMTLVLSGCLFNKQEKKETVSSVTLKESLQKAARSVSNEKYKTTTGIIAGLFLKDAAYNLYFFEDFFSMTADQENEFALNWGNADVDASFVVMADDSIVSLRKIREYDNDIYKALKVSGINISSTQFTNAISNTTAVKGVMKGLNMYADGTGLKGLFSPDGGEYISNQNVTISTGESNSTIYYTTDGTKPTTASALYSAPIDVTDSVKIRTLAIKSGWYSSYSEADYNIRTTAKPVINGEGGIFTTPHVVNISVLTTGAAIRYTIDGDNPTTTSGILYDELKGITVPLNSTYTIKAVAYKEGYGISEVTAPKVFNVTGTASDPGSNVPSGYYPGVALLSLELTSATQGATIRYTTDGQEPTESSAAYTAPIIINSNQHLIIKAKTFKENWLSSNTVSYEYTMWGKAEKPLLTPNAGNYQTQQTVAMSTPTDGAKIYYTTDGTNPTAASNLYSNPIQISTTTRIKAVALKPQWDDSDITDNLYYFGTVDNTAPVKGADIIVSNVTAKSMTVTWSKGSDDITPQDNLEYKLVKSLNLTDIDTLEKTNLLQYRDIVSEWATNVTAKNITGLISDTTYYVAVIVRDNAGNETLYDIVSQKTSIEDY